MSTRNNKPGKVVDKTFTLFWLDGKRELVVGPTPAEAMNRAGYGGGAVRALDFFAEGDDKSYAYQDKDWVKVTAPAATVVTA